MKKIHESIICAGQGGQGIIMMGKLLTGSAMRTGYHTTWIPSYGAEVRGGTAHSMIRIQNPDEIANPVVVNPKTCIIMNQPSLDKFLTRVQPGGLILVDNSIVQRIPNNSKAIVKRAPFTELARQLGDKRTANMIAIGMLNRIKQLLPMKALLHTLTVLMKKKPELLEINEKALYRGYNLTVT